MRGYYVEANGVYVERIVWVYVEVQCGYMLRYRIGMCGDIL